MVDCCLPKHDSDFHYLWEKEKAKNLQLLDEIERLKSNKCANCYCDTCEALQIKQVVVYT